jgi:hypothetical protein
MRPFDIPIVTVFLVLVAFFVWRQLRDLRSSPRSKSFGHRVGSSFVSIDLVFGWYHSEIANYLDCRLLSSANYHNASR